ncbi:MAG TPA: serine/threonine-protein kinase [Polyangiaceae bacterium]|nr:serine/threonine-protein kinase [Polyangiaceae bacterium]
MQLTHGFPPATGSLIDGKYVVTGFVGSGGTGVVLAARHRDLGHLVAIKLLHPELASSSEVVTRFLREARAMSRLKSEHVVGVIDVERLPNGIPYFVMEHLTGSDLSTRLAERGPLPIEDLVDYVLQALEALAEAHRRGIVHRDLKPSNLWLTTREDDSAFVKVLDFGTSKIARSELTANEPPLTRSGSLLGSPLYMAPEQIRSARLADARSDIWSLGVVMHELLTGHPPFRGQFLGEMISAVCSDAYALPAREDLPAELAEILMKCLQKQPELRYQSAAELARAFQPLVRTASSQVSIDRILRVPSSAPPPLADVVTVDALGAGPISLTDTLERPTSLAPHAELGDSRATRSQRSSLTALAFVALGAAGAFTWLRLERALPGHAVGATPTPAAATARPTPSQNEPKLAATAAPAPGREPRNLPLRRRTLGARSVPASSARPPTNERADDAKPTPGTLTPETRTLDGENPFGHR